MPTQPIQMKMHLFANYLKESWTNDSTQISNVD